MTGVAAKSTGDTRADFLSAAKTLFAKRGFYGVSIASIAAELGLTKQALLHHFGSKEKLYGAVLEQISQELEALIGEAGEEPFSEIMNRVRNAFLQDADAAALVMRELLDNEPRASKSRVWYLRDFLNRLCDLAERDAQFEGCNRVECFAEVYKLAGAANFFAVSEATLTGMYGKPFYKDLAAVMHSSES